MKPRTDASRTAAGQSERGDGGASAERGAPDRVDAINQLFAEFELAFHNQYHKAYGDADRLALTKKYWLQNLSDFSPAQIVAAARKLVRSQEFLPTLSVVIRACEEGGSLFGLPDERQAYVEACRAPSPKSAWQWSHPAVYHAGRAAGWHLLASEPEDRALPVFARYYREICQRVMRGEDISEPVPPALEDNPSTPLTDEQREARLRALRRELDV